MNQLSPPQTQQPPQPSFTRRSALPGILQTPPAPATRKISKRSIADDIRAGFPDAAIMERHNLTRSQLNVVLRTLQYDGLLDTVYTCPSCGLRAAEPIMECPRCGVVIAKFGTAKTERRSIWEMIWGTFSNAWDVIDRGGYRLLMKLKSKLG